MPSLHSPKIDVLIVDDEVQTRELLSEFCRAHGYEVATANDGRAAIAALLRSPHQFRIVITDLQLPGADGFEVLTSAREANPSVYVVMITGYASIDSAVRAVREGAYDYLAKPFALGQLEVVLRRIKDRMSLEEENRELNRRITGQEQHAAAGGGDLGWRLQAIEERLAHIEALLKARA
jgi:DNA-binding NtrC family response regulator